jgi:hypothetical protein
VFSVDLLDKHCKFNNVYETDRGGNTTRYRQPVQPVASPLDCPICHKPLAGVKRYASIQKLKDLHREFDQVYARFGQMLARFENLLLTYEEDVQLRFTIFCSSITLSPLTNAKNQRLIQQRGSNLDEFQTAVCSFRGRFQCMPPYVYRYMLTWVYRRVRKTIRTWG